MTNFVLKKLLDKHEPEKDFKVYIFRNHDGKPMKDEHFDPIQYEMDKNNPNIELIQININYV